MTGWAEQDDKSEDLFADIRKDASEKLDGNFPGLKPLLKRLQDEQYGKAISRSIADPVDRSKTMYELEGYMLPLNEDESSHLVIFRNGRMLVLKPHSDEGHAVDGYRQRFKNSSEPISFGTPRSTEQVIDYVRHGANERVVLDNVDFASEDKFGEVIDQAYSTAKTLKEKRDKANENTARLFIDKMGGLFRRTPPPSPDVPPSSPPFLPPGNGSY